MNKVIAEAIVEFGNEQFNPPNGICTYEVVVEDGEYVVHETMTTTRKECHFLKKGEVRLSHRYYHNLSEFIIEVGPCFHIE